MKDKTSDDLLTVELEKLHDEVMIVRLAGEIDLSSAHLLSSQLAGLLDEPLSAVVLDATKVSFMDSTGLHALVEGKRALHDKEIEIYLVPSRQVRRVLELVFPDKLFAARVDSVDDALAAIESAATA